ncbi:MAG: hypothetical protein H6733_16930 [Alphaproteobacteria bacterium]|nr:hypothetical protein [Alphaproteobacteria bacterium]
MTGLLTLATWVVLVVTLLAHRPALRRPTAAVGLAVLVGVAALVVAGPTALPLDALWMTREGTEDYVHVALQLPPALPLAPDPSTLPPGFVTWRVVVWLNLVLCVVALGALTVTARVGVGRALTAAVVLAVACSPWARAAALSEGPAGTAVLLSLVGFHGVVASRDRNRSVRAVGAMVTALVASTLAQVRFEFAGLGVPLAAVAIASAVDPGMVDRVDAWVARQRWAVLALAAWCAQTVAVAGIEHAYVWLDAPPASVGQLPPVLSWDGLQGLRLPLDLLAFLPLGLAVLVLAGLARGLRQGAAGWVGVTAVVGLAHVIADVSHLGAAPFETLRYLAPLLGAFAVLAVVGAAGLPTRARRAVALGVAVTALLPRLGAPAELAVPPWQPPNDTQTAGARFLAEVEARFPTCVMATRVVAHGGHWTDALTFRTVLFGPAMPVPVLRPVDDGLLATASPAALVPDSPVTPDCVLFVATLDCAISAEGADPGCARWTTGTPVLERTVDVPELNTHHPRHVRPMTLGAWRLR